MSESDERRLINPVVQIKGKDTMIHFKDAIFAYEHFCSQEDSLAYDLQTNPHKLIGMIWMAKAQEYGLPPKESFKAADDMVNFMQYICEKVATGEITVYHRPPK